MERNPFNLWNPGPESEILDVAFSAYAKHKTECDDIAEMIDEAVSQGRSYSNVQLDDDFSDADLRYIESECRKRGMFVKLTLS